MSPPIHTFQIYYNPATRAELDPGFQALDNLANPRPDWREYWPIRQWLLAHPVLDEGAWYGFFSPKFGAKTGLTAAQVLAFAALQDERNDVIGFSPFFDQIAMFLNIYEQGESHHPGLLAAAQEFVARIGRRETLAALVGHSRNTLYSNFFLARPAFWREWLTVNEALFALCETADTPLAAALNAATAHDDAAGCPLKVFVMERTASLLLASGRYRSVHYAPSTLPRAPSPAARLGEELIRADALKLAYAGTGDAAYLTAFLQLRREAIARLHAS